MRKPIARYYQAGPQGGVYYVASSGARVYVDRSTPLGQRSSGSRLVSINPGDKDYGERSSQDAPANPNPRYWALDFAALGAFCLVILPLILR